MSVKTWLIGAAAVVVLGGATVVVLGQKDGAQSGTTTKQTGAKTSADKKESAKSKDDEFGLIRPYEAAQSSKRQIWLAVNATDDVPVITKDAMVTGVLVTQNGQATAYELWESDAQPTVAELDNLSDDDLIAKAKSVSTKTITGKLHAELRTDDTGNEVASEFLTVGNPNSVDESSSFAPLMESGDLGTVLTHDYWGFVNDGGTTGEDFYFLVQRYKSGSKGAIYSHDAITTKGVTVE